MQLKAVVLFYLSAEYLSLVSPLTSYSSVQKVISLLYVHIMVHYKTILRCVILKKSSWLVKVVCKVSCVQFCVVQCFSTARGCLNSNTTALWICNLNLLDICHLFHLSDRWRKMTNIRCANSQFETQYDS